MYGLGDKRVVSAAEKDGSGSAICEGFAEVDAEDVASDGVVGPAFLDEWDEEGASFFSGLEAVGGAGFTVGVRLDGGGRGQDEDLGRQGRKSRFLPCPFGKLKVRL